MDKINQTKMIFFVAIRKSLRHTGKIYIESVSGCSSGVEHNLAKVGVVGSNPIARSIEFCIYSFLRGACSLPAGFV